LGQSPRVAEQIICASVGCTGLDYQSYVLSTGAVGIDGVAFGLDITAANYAAAIAGAFTFASAAGGGDGGFPDVTACAIGVCGNTTVMGIPADTPPPAVGPVFAWDFEEWQDPETAALPATFYITGWYSPVQGPGPSFLAPGRYTRRDLFGTSSPASGTRVVVGPESFDTMPSLEFEGLNGDLNIDPNIASDWDKPCDPSGGNTSCPPGTAKSDSLFGAGTFRRAPMTESAFVVLAAGGILMLGAGGTLMLAVRELRRAHKA
jgi:hypothetical protein